MQRVEQALQFQIIVEWGGLHPRESQLPEKLDLFRTRITPEGGILEKSFEPRLFDDRWGGFRSTNSSRVGRPGTRRRLKTISIANVSRSMSHDSISGSRNVTQLSIEMLKTSVSRNSSTMTRICLQLLLLSRATVRSHFSSSSSSLATRLTTSKSFWVTRRSKAPKGSFSNIVRIAFLLRGSLLRRISSRTPRCKGVGGSVKVSRRDCGLLPTLQII